MIILKLLTIFSITLMTKSQKFRFWQQNLNELYSSKVAAGNNTNNRTKSTNITRAPTPLPTISINLPPTPETQTVVNFTIDITLNNVDVSEYLKNSLNGGQTIVLGLQGILPGVVYVSLDSADNDTTTAAHTMDIQIQTIQFSGVFFSRALPEEINPSDKVEDRALEASAEGCGSGTLKVVVSVTYSVESLGYTPEQAYASYEAVIEALSNGLNAFEIFLQTSNPSMFSCTTVGSAMPSEPTIKYVISAAPTLIPVQMPPQDMSDTNFTDTNTDGGTIHLMDATAPLCIEIVLADLFGDGWGGANLLLFSFPDKRHINYNPTCLENPLYTTFCFDEITDPDGAYVMMKVVGFMPSYAWEIFWRATIANGNTYEGDYDTSLIFSLRRPDDADPYIELKSSREMFEDPHECDECMAPERHSVSGSKISMKKHTHKKHSTPSTSGVSGSMNHVSDILSKRHGKGHSGRGHSKQRKMLQNADSVLYVDTSGHMASTLDLVYELNGYGKERYSSLYGPDFYITTDTDELLVSGALCESGTSDCGMSFLDGSYALRVTGGLFSGGSVDWEFCGVKGEEASELLFSVSRGSCTVLSLSKTIVNCVSAGVKSASLSLEEAPISIHGIMELEGVGSGLLSADEAEALRHAINEEFRDANVGSAILPDDATSVELLSTDVQKHEPVSRRIDEISTSDTTVGIKQIAFKVTMNAPEFNVQQLKSYLDKSLSSGLFISRVRTFTNVADNLGLSGMTKASLLDLRIIHETLENKEISLMATAVVTGFGVAGLVFAMMLLLSYSRLRSDVFKYEVAPVAETEMIDQKTLTELRI